MNEQTYASLMKRASEKELSALELMSSASEVELYDKSKLLELYKLWIENNQDDGLLYAIYFNYGIVLGASGLTAEACNAYILAININKQLFPAYINLASAYEKFNRTDLAIQIHEELLRLLSLLTPENIKHKALALVQLSRIQIAQGNTDAAEKCLLESLSLNQNQPEILMHVVDLRLKQCKWPVFEIQSSARRADFVKNMAPLTVAAYSNDPLLHLSISHAYSNKTIKAIPVPIIKKPLPADSQKKDKRLRIGYLSSDLYGHAIGSLMSDIFGLHERAKIEVVAYYFGPERDDFFQKRIKRDVDGWIDISALNDAEAAQRIADDGVDILVDVNGHSMNARTTILAYNPAPIMVNWLGFPGTMGSAYHHYIIADDYLVPDGYDMFYSEKVMRLPCYQPNDRQRIVSDQPVSRLDCGLKEDVFVFCCFNGCQKITEQIFMLWMEILRGVPDSQLWVLSDNDDVNNRLRERAAKSGIAPERVVFAERKANHEHLKRYQLADLFLDTFPYGAHTTASDSLWMGVPVVTLSGRGFASRVCGSLVRSAGIGELICTSPEEYVAKAIEIGLSREHSNYLKESLAKQKNSCVLFDMPLLVRSLDQLYRQMWHEYLDGDLHQPDLANLDEYLEVGMALDQEVATFAPLAELLDAYRARLERKSRKPGSRLLGNGLKASKRKSNEIAQDSRIDIAASDVKSDDEAFFDLFSALLNHGRNKEVLTICRYILNGKPEDTPALFFAAKALQAEGESEAALEYMARIIEGGILPPDFPFNLAEEARNLLVSAVACHGQYISTGKLIEALQITENMIRISPTAKPFLESALSISRTLGNNVKASGFALRLQDLNRV